jgi:mannose-6-phosphate isomerase-like protein (cupin superfamily)
MKIARISERNGFFEVLETTRLSQSATMVLGPGESSSEELNTHPNSDQTLVVLQGKLTAEIGSEKGEIHPGDAVTVPAGTPHRFTNPGPGKTVSFSVYSPPAY